MAANKELPKSKSKRTLFGLHVDAPWAPYLVFGLVVSLWMLCWILVSNLMNEPNGGSWGIRGQFGDMFGAVNALFSGLAFAGIIYTILLQREELEAQRNELRITNKNLKTQRIENTLLTLLTLHNDLTNNVKYKSVVGRSAIGWLISSVVPSDYTGMNFNSLSGEKLAAMKQEYATEIYPQMRSVVQHYFNSLVNTYSIISRTSSRTKSIYQNILKGYLSHYEIELLYLHTSLSNESPDEIINLKEVCRELNLFSNLSGLDDRSMEGYISSF